MGQAYNEETFRYFLAVERRRAAQSRRSFLLVFVTLKRPQGSDRMSSSVAAGIFSGLAVSVREVDFIGWYRQERVAAAVLTQGVDASTTDGWSGIVQRINEALSVHVPEVGPRLQVRVLQLRPRQES